LFVNAVINISTEDGNQTRENQSLETMSEVNHLHFVPIGKTTPFVNIDNNECNITVLSYMIKLILKRVMLTHMVSE
jgi:hypothetical protein